LIPRCYVDRGNVAEGLKHLRHYHRQFNDRTGDWKDKPNHDKSSHACDAFRYLAVGLRDGSSDELAHAARTGRMSNGLPVMAAMDTDFG